MTKITKTQNEWQQQLSPEEFHVCREKGTERAFTGQYVDCKEKGVYHCVCCGNSLFSSETKYDSGSGWPSFYQPLTQESVDTTEDHSFFMQRVEVVCKQCGAHLGHVFEDGPEPTGLRYCMNSVALKLEKDKT